MVTARASKSQLDPTLLPLHPILAAAYPVLFLFAQNVADQVTLGPLWGPLAVAMAGGGVALVVGRILIGDWRRGALLATVVAALFFSFGHVWFAVGETLVLRRYLIGIYAVVGIVVAVLIWRGGRWIMPVTRALNLGLAGLVLINAFTIGSVVATVSANAPAAEPLAVSAEGRDRPDVYYIILDRYANGWTLEHLYGYDNTPFLDALRERGFYVADEAWANYFKTPFSIASSLDMSHLDGAALGARATEGHEFGPINAMLRGHLAGPATFKALGYEYVHIGTFWEPSVTNADADVVLNYGDGLEFSTALGETTALSLLSPARPAATTRTIYTGDLVRRFHEYGFTEVERAAERDGPTFVFAHFLLPHPPFVYMPDGSAPTAADGPRTDEERYTDQVQYANLRVLRAIDTIMASPGGQDATIIIQADEGPFPVEFDANQRNFAWLEATPEQIAQKFGILNAVRIPGATPEQLGLHPRSSPVNALRMVLNGLFDAGLPLLPDTVFLSPDYPHAYDFVAVERDPDGLPIMSTVAEDPG
ncbi:MAG: hypothetical protein ACRDGD_08615 [Candidatus Limnocylindria bacterium]